MAARAANIVVVRRVAAANGQAAAAIMAAGRMVAGPVAAIIRAGPVAGRAAIVPADRAGAVTMAARIRAGPAETDPIMAGRVAMARVSGQATVRAEVDTGARRIRAG